ncbi:MAG: 5'-methylthioadenosine/S-adenosylhomocysteine nucleosidase [Solimonas sp.]
MKTVKALAAAAAFACAAAQALDAPDTPVHYRPTDTIVVLGAVPQEIPPFVEAMKDAQKKDLWGIPYWQGHIAGKPVVVAITGIGKTSTGMTTTLFVSTFKPRLVLMSGTGARINQALRTGDVIVATHMTEHDYGSLTKNDMVYRPFNGPDDGAEIVNDFSPSPTLLQRADAAMKTYEGPQVSANGATYAVKVRRGIVSSSDLFGVTEQRIATLRKDFHTDIMEMESAPMAHTLQILGVPYIVVRAGSNVAQEAPNDDYLRLGPIAARQAALFSLHLLRSL